MEICFKRVGDPDGIQYTVESLQHEFLVTEGFDRDHDFWVVSYSYYNGRAEVIFRTPNKGFAYEIVDQIHDREQAGDHFFDLKKFIGR